MGFKFFSHGFNLNTLAVYPLCRIKVFPEGLTGKGGMDLITFIWTLK